MWGCLKREKLQGHEMKAHTNTHTHEERMLVRGSQEFLCESVCGCNGKLFFYTRNTHLQKHEERKHKWLFYQRLLALPYFMCILGNEL